MKKTLSLLCVAAMLFVLPSCGNNNTNSAPASASPESLKTTEPDSSLSDETPKTSERKALVAYFSWSVIAPIPTPAKI